MYETPSHIALIESASIEGVESRKRHLLENGPHELGWSYSNILDVGRRLQNQIRKRGFFRLYLYIPDSGNGKILYWMKITNLKTFRKPELFADPVDGRRYLIHSRMLIQSIEDIREERELSGFRSADRRWPDPRHLALGFLFAVDPEA